MPSTDHTPKSCIRFLSHARVRAIVHFADEETECKRNDAPCSGRIAREGTEAFVQLVPGQAEHPAETQLFQLHYPAPPAPH